MNDWSPFSAPPLDVQDGIPVFSRTDRYIANYERIAQDHLAALQATGRNPFVDESMSQAAEDATAALVAHFAPPRARILDVGVGLGRLLARFERFERYGMDISLPYLREAKKAGIDVCLALVEDMPFKPSSFDVVVCTDVLEHVLDVHLACTRILSVLKPGGALIARVPYREDLAKYTAPDRPYELVHLRSFDEHSLRLLFEQVFGCHVLTTETCVYAANPDRLRLPIAFPKRDGILRRILAAADRLSPQARRRLIERWYLPIEINVVVRKP